MTFNYVQQHLKTKQILKMLETFINLTTMKNSPEKNPFGFNSYAQ